MAIDKNKVTGRERHPDGPPDQANFQAVARGAGIVDGKRVVGIGAGGQHVRIDAEDNAGEHAEQIRAGGKKSAALGHAIDRAFAMPPRAHRAG